MKYVIFDIDGTLTDTKSVEDRCFMHAFEQTFSININNQKWEDLKHVTDWGITEEIIQRELGRSPSKDEYELMISNFVNKLKEERTKDSSQFREVIGAKHFFDSLRRNEKIALGIATGSWERSALLKLETIGIDLQDICFSNSDYHKSRGAIIQDVMDQLKKISQQIPQQIIYFGDGIWDFKVSQNLGIKFIGIDIKKDGILTKMGAKAVFPNYQNSEQILKELELVV